jgi:hypothetical protein
MKSGGQIDGHVSAQSPVAWWYREVNCEIVGMCVEAVPVLGAESVDWILYCCGTRLSLGEHHSFSAALLTAA